MKYENHPCPVCGSHLHEEDDVVVCPECATPQHRKCWLETGHCINESRHSDGYVWAPDENIITENDASVNSDVNTDTKVCHICGSENPADAERCGSCSALLVPGFEEEKHCPYCGMRYRGNMPICVRCGGPLTEEAKHNFNPASSPLGFDENDTISGRPAAEFALYVKTGVPKYLKRFKDFDAGKNFSFNWAAFFFGPLWFFFRKIYKAGIMLLIVCACAGLVFTSAMNTISAELSPYSDEILNHTISDEKLAEVLSSAISGSIGPIAAGIGIMLIINLICGFAGNMIYYKKILSDFSILEREVEDEIMRKMLISRRGGVSILSGICGYCTYQLFGSILLYIADYATNLF